MSAGLINLAYLAAAVLFIVGLKGLTHPRTAVQGNLVSGLGMLIAVVVTMLDRQILSFGWILAGLLLGTALGAVMAVRVKMTAMPQMVALLNGFGGAASVLVAGAALIEAVGIAERAVNLQLTVATAASGLVGAITFTGSVAAWAKLEERISGNAVQFPGQHVLNAVLGLAALALAAGVALQPERVWLYWALSLIACVLGVLLVIPIGGADMPVVISLLNSYSGIAGCATGFVLNNTMLVVAGALVGASGIILTQIMCKAMNRSLANVLFGGVGGAPAGQAAQADDVYAGRIKSTTPE
ncbi:MAG TPA: NAD(P)(+) transhydrogenase (Re/Si-specific) subunit beta, partial [Vicinamibacteria bacterium]|nr:NAD(P)(+) transhydrogenase (Re/Si-specific) subunit beta [Vicinamibacteria bacterium]